MASLLSLLIQETKEALYEYAIGVADALGVPVDSWQPGDPTRSLFHFETEILAQLEGIVVNFIKAGFLEHAEGEWLKVLAKQVFNVDVPAATFATTSVVLTNNGGGNYPDIGAGDLIVKSSTSGKTYTNTSGGNLPPGPGTTLTVTVSADEAGSESSASAGEIDTIVVGPNGVTCTNPRAAIGTDEWDKATIVAQCRDKLGSLSPDGPREAYRYVARNSELTGTSVVTDARVYADSDTGDVTVYLRSGSGGVAEADRALVEAAILKWATPLCITPTVLSATPVTIAVTYELWVYASVAKTEAQIKEDVEAALEKMIASRPIGGDTIPPSSGAIYHSMIESTIRGTYSQIFRCLLTAPSGDTTLTEGQVAALGTVTGTIHIVQDA